MMAEKPILGDFPPEIISEIFVRYPPWASSPQTGAEFQNARPPTRFDPRNAPFLFMHVCRRWRFIAEAMPTLWTRLPMTRSTEAQELYEMYIKNSGGAPLWIHLTSGDAGRKVADILIPHSHRWELLTITIRDHPDDPASIELPNLPTQLPLLKHLHLQQTYPSYHAESDIYRLPEFVAPLLRSVRISSSNVLGLKLPWSQLTHYSGEFECSPDAHAFLSRCPNLETLHLRNPKQSRHMVIIGVTTPPIHLPRLHELSLINEHVLESHYYHLIECLFLPALETVRFGVTLDHRIILGALCRCVARSSPGGVPRLHSVEVQCSQDQSLDHSNMRELSLVAPGIRELRISRPSSEAVLAMKYHPTDLPLFPNLQHLVMIDPLLKGRELVDVIMSRCYLSAPDLDSCISLRCVGITFTKDPILESLSVTRRGMIELLHERFQGVDECFTVVQAGEESQVLREGEAVVDSQEVIGSYLMRPRPVTVPSKSFQAVRDEQTSLAGPVQLSLNHWAISYDREKPEISFSSFHN